MSRTLPRLDSSSPDAKHAQASPFLSAQWRWLAVLNYAIDPQLLEPFVPRGVELDFDVQGKTYVSLVGFLFQETRVLGCSCPGYREFEELNLRFYVVRRTGSEVRRGVVFIKELVPKRLVTWVARACYNENYFTVAMQHDVKPAAPDQRSEAPEVRYAFRHRGEWNMIRVAGHPHPVVPELSSHEAFILEHYWGYCRQRDGGTIEYRVDHPRWTVWPAAEVEIDCHFGPLYGETLAGVLSRQPDSALIADGSAVTVARPVRIA